MKFNCRVTLVNRIRACEGVDTNVIQFQTHNCTQDKEITILLRESIVT